MKPFFVSAILLLIQVSSFAQDYSDAPASYGAPVHTIVSGFSIGATDPDAEAGAIPTILADGDNNDGTNDEADIAIPQLQIGKTGTINVPVRGTGGYLQVWIDWNRNGVFDIGEQISVNMQDNGTGGDLIAGDGIINVTVTPPATSTNYRTYARFRWSTTLGLNSTDAAPNGEVEDYMLFVWPASISNVTPFSGCPAMGVHMLGSSQGRHVNFKTGATTIFRTALSFTSNAAGFNTNDARVYAAADAYPYAADDVDAIIAFGPDGTYAYYGGVFPTGQSVNGLNVGDVDGDGYLHATAASPGAAIYVVDVTPSRPTFMTVVRTYSRTATTPLSTPRLGVDMAYRPADGLFYSLKSIGTGASMAELVSLNSTTGEVKLVKSFSVGVSEVLQENLSFGGVYMFADNQMIAMANETGALYRIDLSNPSDITVHAAGQTDLSNIGNNDGASCPLIAYGEVMPVIFGHISAIFKNKQLLVNWQTLSETNNDRFEIQASVNGKHFTKIGEVKSKAAAGHSGASLDYSFSIDANDMALTAGMGLLIMSFAFKRRSRAVFVLLVAIGIVISISACSTKNEADLIPDNSALFIRIAQVDKDGVKSYSKVIKVMHR